MKCCLCGKNAGKCGNNAMPLANGQCCNDCNNNKVIPARLAGYHETDSEAAYEDLIKYSKKVNAIIAESVNGDCPQIYKILLMHKMISANVALLQHTNKEVFDECNNLIDEIMLENGEAVIKHHKHGEVNDL